MQIILFCMADFMRRQLCPWNWTFGAPGEIRTPDPQIRSLVLNGCLNEASKVAGLDAGLDYRLTSIGETL
jgi:hypothetical protein